MDFTRNGLSRGGFWLNKFKVLKVGSYKRKVIIRLELHWHELKLVDQRQQSEKKAKGKRRMVVDPEMESPSRKAQAFFYRLLTG